MLRTTCFLKILTVFLIFFIYNMLFDYMSFAHAQENSVYLIHVSSFKNRNKAEREISNLKKLDLQAFYRYESVKGKGQWFRVYIGTFNNKKEAQERGSELLGKGVITYYKLKQAQQRITANKEPIQSEIIEEQYFKEPEEMKMLPVIKFRKEFSKKTKGSTEPNKKSAENTGDVIEATEIKVKKARIIHAQAKDFKVASQTMKKTAEVDSTSRDKLHKPRTILDNTDSATKKAVKGAQYSKSPFTLSLNAGGFRSGSASDFQITEVIGATTNIYGLKTMSSQIAFAPSFRLYKDYDLYSSITYLFGNRINSMFLSLGPKKTFDISDWASIYLKGGAVYGNFNWNGPPGDFEDDYGWETGFGVDIFRSRFKSGIDFLYRNIEFGYSTQGISGVSANGSTIDFSGFSVSGSIKYVF